MESEILNQLYQQQLQDFELARTNYTNLHQVVYRELQTEDITFRVQYNPARIRSTNAKIDPDTLQKRSCFLCKNAMPIQQKGIPYGAQYHIFINPFPIFDQHFTVTSNDHTPQLIENRFKDLLNLAFDFQDRTIFYNGPACGASAPDHFHFQIAPRHQMPLEEETGNEQLRETICPGDYYSVSILKDYLRKVIILQSSDQQLLTNLFHQVSQIIGQYIPYQTEVMMNLLAWFDNCQWTICLFPRRKLRPWQFFAEDEQKILFSPGSVDMAGLIVAPRKEDFDRYSIPLLTDLYQQISADTDSWNQILNEISALS